MGAGIRIRNASGYLQIDGESQHIVLQSKGTISGQALSNAQNKTTQCYFTLAVPDGAIAAFQGQAGFTIAGKSNGVWTLYMSGAGPGAWLNYWLFAPYSYSGGGVGVIIRNGNGTPLWDTNHLPLRYVQKVAGSGSFTVGQAGRSYAIMPTQLFARLLRGAAQDPLNQQLSVLNYVFTAGFVNVSGQTVTSASPVTILAGVVPSQSSEPVGWATDQSNNLQNEVIVVDVTGY